MVHVLQRYPIVFWRSLTQRQALPAWTLGALGCWNFALVHLPFLRSLAGAPSAWSPPWWAWGWAAALWLYGSALHVAAMNQEQLDRARAANSLEDLIARMQEQHYWIDGSPVQLSAVFGQLAKRLVSLTSPSHAA